MKKPVKAYKQSRRSAKRSPDMKAGKNRNLPRQIRQPDSAQEKRQSNEKAEFRPSVFIPAKLQQISPLQLKIVSGDRTPEKENPPLPFPVSYY